MAKQPTVWELWEGGGLVGKSPSRSKSWQNFVPPVWMRQDPIWDQNKNELLRNRAKASFYQERESRIAVSTEFLGLSNKSTGVNLLIISLYGQKSPTEFHSCHRIL